MLQRRACDRREVARQHAASERVAPRPQQRQGPRGCPACAAAPAQPAAAIHSALRARFGVSTWIHLQIDGTLPIFAPKAHLRPLPTLATAGSNENVPFRSAGGSQARVACTAPPPRSPTQRGGSWQSPNLDSQTGPMWILECWRQDRTLLVAWRTARLGTRPGFPARDGAVSASAALPQRLSTKGDLHPRNKIFHEVHF